MSKRTGKRPVKLDGLHTSKYKQSSLPQTLLGCVDPHDWVHIGPCHIVNIYLMIRITYWFADRTSVQLSGGWGGAHRKLLIGGEANGIPRNAFTLPWLST